MVWVEVWQQAVAAVEDSEKFEASLGSADTALNVRTMRRVHVTTGVGTDDCATAWNTFLAGIAPTMGTLAPGFEADSVAVPGNPVTDITNVHHVRFVMKGGRVFKRQ